MNTQQEAIMSDKRLVFNGINVDTGDYLLPPMQLHDFATRLRGVGRDKIGFIEQLQAWLTKRSGKFMGVVPWVEHPENLAEAGWGVIFAAKTDPDVLEAIREALDPLLKRRKSQAGDYYREYSADKGDRRGYLPRDNKAKWLADNGASSSGPADPKKVPYYLLIVGDPQTIPFEFQYQLDVQYAVGRIHFTTPGEYHQYACSVVAAETNQVQRPLRATFFASQNGDDPATLFSTSKLTKPLYEALSNDQQSQQGQDNPGWVLELECITEGANKDRLGHLLGGDNTPALLFTTSHGLGGFRVGDPRQERLQGALICDDWSGPGTRILPEHFFSGEDIRGDARLSGLISFHFACYSAGTPLQDDFPQQARGQRKAIALRPFVAGLSAKLLGHAAGGALAVVGHVERASTYSFLGEGEADQASPQLEVYRSTFTQLMRGRPVGMAMEYFNQRFAELAVSWKEMQDKITEGIRVSDEDVADLWMSNNDARNFVIIGDPAVRLRAP
jgi:hypothetical protein